MANADGYSLRRDATESERLVQQNRVFNDCVGYHLHPTIIPNLPTAPKIAELATAAGAFMISLSGQLSSEAQLDGYDISSASFLPASSLPKNVTLSTSDAKLAPPQENCGKYDVVVIRFINVALQPEDWSKVALHAFALLKPGGALQWIEGDILQLQTTYLSVPSAKTSASDKLASMAIAKMQQMRWFVDNLPAVLEEAGFEGVRRQVTGSDRLAETRREMSFIAHGAFHSILRVQVENGVLGAGEVEALKEEADGEVDGGVYKRVDMHQFVAFKKAA